MLSPILAATMARRGVHYGWIVVGVAFLTMLATAAVMAMPGVLLLPLQGEFDWDLGVISGVLALRLALYGLMAPFAAALMLRYGIRVVVSSALVLIVLGLALSTQMTAVWQLWLTGAHAWPRQGDCNVLGATSQVAGSQAARPRCGRTEQRCHGTAAVPAGNRRLLGYSGWRQAMMPAAGLCLVCLVLVLLFMRDHPGDVDLASYGEDEIVRPPAQRAGSNALKLSFAALAMGSRNRAFWILAATFFICGLSTNGLVQNHFIPLCHDFGMGTMAASGVLALMGACNFVGTIISGWLSDRYDNRWLLSWFYGLRGLSLLLLPYSNFSFFGLSLFAVFYGLDWIATVPPTVKLSGQTFGREQGPLIFGWVFTGHQLGAATAAFAAGASRGILLSYLPAFVFAGAACLVAAMAVLTVRRRSADAVRAVAAV